ncbi:MAG: hypothetical protein ABIR37_04640 [Candidatus Saccharimonadales bacterium]
MKTRDASSLSLPEHRQVLIDIIEQTDRIGTTFSQYTLPWDDAEGPSFPLRYQVELQNTRNEINLTLATLGGLACKIDFNDGKGESPYTLIAWLGGQAGKMDWMVTEIPKNPITLDRSVIDELRALHTSI